ncbi:uncharacterized protein RAG0_10905 [Rhynchosporium agropyri]|uniref:Uncharacterized protein n=1 Tax=Rhynchosporium agropyri TaxID=914238 RepID=A0A1E1L1U5_9HELO|nr:uncharacterized protein RAG0_10905 [Rhynchosporium agropyri]
MSLSQVLSEQKRHAWFSWCASACCNLNAQFRPRISRDKTTKTAVLRRFGYERYQEAQGFHGPRLLNHARNLSNYR